MLIDFLALFSGFSNYLVLERLEHYHLKLQLELGKRNTPYKETIVELAILQLLDQLESDSEHLWSKLQQQQQLRDSSGKKG